MSALASFHAGGEPFIVCRLARGGDFTHRRAVECTVEGHALLGPATFPSVRPETGPGERAVYRRGSWWIVARREPRGVRKVRG